MDNYIVERNRFGRTFMCLGALSQRGRKYRCRVLVRTEVDFVDQGGGPIAVHPKKGQ